LEAVVTNQADFKIKTLRTDNGGEYMSAEFQNVLKEKVIHHETTVLHSPQQNGIAERMNKDAPGSCFINDLTCRSIQEFLG
jgi:transposase InsO family protein